jgi:protein-S-isoprenylcysteine O-methyltransferase Ste14
LVQGQTGISKPRINAKGDSVFGITGFRPIFATSIGWLLLVVGFLVRVRATFYFYERQMKVISLVPQKVLITSGPYRFSRNPLYLGGNVFIFFGAGLLVGSPIALLITAFHLPFVDLFIRREEKQLGEDFGQEWMRYKNQVRRWI